MVLAVAAAGLGSASPVGAVGRGSWEPVEQPAFSVPAGRYCDFAWSYQPTSQDLRQRVLERYPDGSPRVVELAGRLHGRTTNDETGESVDRNASGRMVEHLRQDGSIERYEMFGPVGHGFAAGSEGIGQGYYLLHGRTVVDVAPDGTKSLTVSHGTRENLCETLDG